jgi:predicted DNA binding CopG/RHH family protein
MTLQNFLRLCQQFQYRYFDLLLRNGESGWGLQVRIRLGDELIEWFKGQVHAAGGGNYQTLINVALRDYVGRKREPLEETLRRVIREELRAG